MAAAIKFVIDVLQLRYIRQLNSNKLLNMKLVCIYIKLWCICKSGVLEANARNVGRHVDIMISNWSSLHYQQLASESIFVWEHFKLSNRRRIQR